MCKWIDASITPPPKEAGILIVTDYFETYYYYKTYTGREYWSNTRDIVDNLDTSDIKKYIVLNHIQ